MNRRRTSLLTLVMAAAAVSTAAVGTITVPAQRARPWHPYRRDMTRSHRNPESGTSRVQ